MNAFRKLIAGAALAVTAIVGATGIAHAASETDSIEQPTTRAAGVRYHTAGPFSITNVRANVTNGVAMVTTNATKLSVSAYIQDKADGHYATLQFRAVYTNGTRSAWNRVGSSANETAPGSMAISPVLTAPSGMTINDAEVRLCQTNRSGGITGTCSIVVPIDGWVERFA
jgi:hypothetical protein